MGGLIASGGGPVASIGGAVASIGRLVATVGGLFPCGRPPGSLTPAFGLRRLAEIRRRPSLIGRVATAPRQDRAHSGLSGHVLPY